MTKLLLLPITLPLRIVRATAEASFGVARAVLVAVRADDERPVGDDDIFAAPAPPEPGAEIHVDEPWAGYDAMELDEVLARLEDASEAEVAIVRLYERRHENRQAVLLATGESP